MKKVVFLLAFCIFQVVLAQEIVDIKNIYLHEDGRIYKITTNQPFSGHAQKIRGNGHLVYEDYFESGFLTETTIYFNRTKEPKPSRRIEYYDKTFLKKKETNYSLSKPTIELIFFDINGRKTLIEQYENDRLTYRCPYSRNKKHGTEFCINTNGKESTFEYRYGKKIKG